MFPNIAFFDPWLGPIDKGVTLTVLCKEVSWFYSSVKLLLWIIFNAETRVWRLKRFTTCSSLWQCWRKLQRIQRYEDHTLERYDSPTINWRKTSVLNGDWFYQSMNLQKRCWVKRSRHFKHHTALSLRKKESVVGNPKRVLTAGYEDNSIKIMFSYLLLNTFQCQTRMRTD